MIIPLFFFQKGVSLKSDRVLHGLSEEVHTEKCPFLQFLGGGIPVCHWEIFLDPEEETIIVKVGEGIFSLEGIPEAGN